MKILESFIVSVSFLDKDYGALIVGKVKECDTE